MMVKSLPDLCNGSLQWMVSFSLDGKHMHTNGSDNDKNDGDDGPGNQIFL